MTAQGFAASHFTMQRVEEQEMTQEMSKCDEMNEQMCLFFCTRSHRSLMCCLTMMFSASNLMRPDCEISTRGQSRSDRFYHFTYKSSLLWSRMQHFQNPASLFFFPIQAAVFAAPQLLTGAVKSVCRIFMVDLPILERCGKVPPLLNPTDLTLPLTSRFLKASFLCICWGLKASQASFI